MRRIFFIGHFGLYLLIFSTLLHASEDNVVFEFKDQKYNFVKLDRLILDCEYISVQSIAKWPRLQIVTVEKSICSSTEQDHHKLNDQDMKMPSHQSRKSTLIALCWSLGASTIPPMAGSWMLSGSGPRSKSVDYFAYTLIATGFFIGPSTGHFYARQWRRGLNHTKIRLIIGACGFSGSALLFIILKPSLSNESDRGKSMVCAIPICVAGVSIIIHDLYDLTTVPFSVYKYNQSLQIKIKPELDLKNKRFGIGITCHL